MDSKKKRRVTIYDLATELNVSPSTISRALKDHYSIGQETITAVKELAKKRGYRPNALAASLRKQQTNTIGVLVSWINRPFISSLISGVEDAARVAGFNVIISQSHDSLENEIANAKALYDSRIHALVVSLAMETQTYQHFEELLSNGVPIVFVDRIPTDMDCHKVSIDNFGAGYSATQHLIDQGCRRIALLIGATHQHIYFERQRGYLEALRRNNLPVDEALIRPSLRLSTEEGIDQTRHLLGLPKPPDGIFSTNDSAAVGAIKYAKSQGLDIPNDLAIIGFNDDPVCTIIEPQLSSIRHPAADMGRMALQQAIKIFDPEGMVASHTVTLKTEVIARASSLRHP